MTNALTTLTWTDVEDLVTKISRIRLTLQRMSDDIDRFVTVGPIGRRRTADGIMSRATGAVSCIDELNARLEKFFGETSTKIVEES